MTEPGNGEVPRCAQCGHPGGAVTLYSWMYGGKRRYICRDATACIERIAAAEEDSACLEDR